MTGVLPLIKVSLAVGCDVMNEVVYEKYRRAGRVAAEARDFGVGLIKVGVGFLEVVDRVEAKIVEDGAGIAFPVNVAVNEVAAHYSPRYEDTSLVFKKGDVVKLDVGAHVDGCIADTAVTVEVGSSVFSRLIRASEMALDKAIEKVAPDVDLSEVGVAVEETVRSYGYKPIDNLSGHSLGFYDLHSGLSIPNIGTVPRKGKPCVGAVLALEPFATNGLGHVISGGGSNIYLCSKSFRSKLIRDHRSKVLFNRITTNFKTLPFAHRWYKDLLGDDSVLKRLCHVGVIKHYPKLIEAKSGIVTQKEHTVIVTEDGCEVIT